MAVTRAGILSAAITFSLKSESETMMEQPRRRRRLINSCLRLGGVWVGKKNLWVEDSKCAPVFGFCETQRNLSRSQSRRAATPRYAAVKIGPATADGTFYRPTEPSAPNIGGRRATVAPKFGPM
jgi:hypothetical protein